MDSLEETKITRAGLLVVCQLKLNYLRIGKALGNIGDNNYGD